MTKYPIVEEVQRIRYQYTARFNYDLTTIFRDLQEQQELGEFTVVSCEPRQRTVQPPIQNLERDEVQPVKVEIDGGGPHLPWRYNIAAHYRFWRV